MTHQLPHTAAVSDGYISVALQDRRFRRALKHPGGVWLPARHGTSVYATNDGTVLATVRTLGCRLPKRDRRYCLRVEGVTFTRIVPLISADRPIRSDLAPYLTAARAMQEGSRLIEQLRTEA